MRSAGTYLLSLLLIAGALSAVVSMATVKWVYPKRPADRTPATAQAGPPANSAATAPTNAAAPTNSPVTAAPPPDPGPAKAATPDEKAALDFLRRAASGDLQGALALTAVGSLTEEAIRDQVTRHRPAVQAVGTLPGATGTTTVLAWVTTASGGQGRSQYQLTIANGKVRSLKGPMAPEGGFGPLPFPLLDEQATQLDMTPYRGRALLLISPRTPEPGLPELMIQFQATYGPLGIDVALVRDLRSPDWVAAARAAGWTGPVWKVKAHLDDVPLVAKGTLLGAYGVLIDPQGNAVASVAALDPVQYNLPVETPPAAIATDVFKAYGLLK